MKFKTGLLIGAAVGYYYGAKAGRDRFEQIDARLEKVRSQPSYQKARDRVGGTLDTARSAVKERAGKVADDAADKVDETLEGIRPEDETSSSTSSDSDSKAS